MIRSKEIILGLSTVSLLLLHFFPLLVSIAQVDCAGQPLSETNQQKNKTSPNITANIKTTSFLANTSGSQQLQLPVNSTPTTATIKPEVKTIDDPGDAPNVKNRRFSFSTAVSNAFSDIRCKFTKTCSYVYVGDGDNSDPSDYAESTGDIRHSLN